MRRTPTPVVAPDKAYIVDAHGSNEHADCPAVAVFSISEVLAREIVRLSVLVSENRLLDCRKMDCSATWLKFNPEENDEDDIAKMLEDGQTNEMRTELDCLVVSDDDFRFTCCLKSCDSLIDCEDQSIEELAAHFDIEWEHPRKMQVVQGSAPSSPSPDMCM